MPSKEIVSVQDYFITHMREGTFSWIAIRILFEDDNDLIYFANYQEGKVCMKNAFMPSGLLYKFHILVPNWRYT